MIEFEYKGIRVEVKTEIRQHTFSIGSKMHINRHNTVSVHFWDFVICDNLYELAVVRSSLNYFMQCYWKRGTKEGIKIDLNTSLEHFDNFGLPQKLKLISRQKNNRYNLEVSIADGFDQQSQCMYLNVQEVNLLDIAFAKAISLLVPEVVYIEY